MTNHNVYSEELIWKSIWRRWLTKRKEHPLLSIIIPIHFIDPLYQIFIFMSLTENSKKKWIEEHLKSEEIKINVHKSTNVKLVNL